MKKIIRFVEKRRGPALNSSCAPSETKEKHVSKLHAAASAGNVAAIRILLMIQREINKQDGELRTPLHLACENGHTAVVLLLVRRNCNLNLCDIEQRTPLITALQCQKIFCAAILLTHNANPNIADIKGNTALHYAVTIPSMTLVLQLRACGAHLDATNLHGYTPLMRAVATNNMDIVQYLLGEGANVNGKGHKGKTSLMIASGKGHISLVRMLLQHDVDIYMSDSKGRTAEAYAANKGHDACLHLILEYKSQKCAKISPALCVNSKMIGPGRGVECGFTLEDHASDKEELQPTSKQTPRARISRKDSSDKTNLAEVEPALKCTEQPPKEKDLAVINAVLQAEIFVLKQELEQVQASSQEKESRHMKEIEILREKVEELSRELKIMKETLTQTVNRDNEQISALKTEVTILSSKVDENKQRKESLETEMESIASRLKSSLQELDKHQMLKAECERSVQQARDAWLREQDKLNHQLSSMREANNSLAQQLHTMEAKSNDLDLELLKTSLALKEKSFLLEKAQRDLTQSAATLQKLEHTLRQQIEEPDKSAIKQESILEHTLQQQIEEPDKSAVKQESILEHTLQQQIEEPDKSAVKQESILEHTLQQQIEEPDKSAVKQEAIEERVAQSVSENLLLGQQLEAQNKGVFSEKDDVCDVLDKYTHLYNELCTDTQRQIHICEEQNKDLTNKNSDFQEKFYRVESEKVECQNTLMQLRPELSDAVKKLEKSEASLEHMTQSKDCLEKEKQNLLQKRQQFNSKVSQLDQDSNNLCEEQPKSRSWLETRLAELKRETIHLKEKVESEKQTAKRFIQYHNETESLLEQENSRLRKLLKMAKTKIRYYETEKGHQNSFQDKAKNQNLDTKSDEIFQMIQELDKSVPQKPSQGIADVDIGSTRVGSAARSLRNLNIYQDPIYRATQEYLEVLKKNMN